ncbi:chromosome segregation SMC family protein [Blastochloris viridis]|uniref:Chromosome partition protein Smc n=1 Tax=Blastochloris viridis TaxID=1079 RepID=A0A0H5BPN8_BLAVI|nr:AAA family ATPase [Blastochloris viridis]ALK10445.1 Chromosome partition protein Smc [Blastochloris viridis]BAR99613.1 chromosome partition protein smc [Blastochloris viridis]CUU43107.1 Chromosome partition protein Smc [Blastochloris viridis]
MKFTRLRLIGFKTFVEPTDVPIEPGLTGVVGPNGCGKSNLVEALRWVMGESSHKAMRANDMEAVIFSGTNSRPPRNAAEVLLTVDNASRTAPAAFNEHDVIEVSRRIERDAGSAYRINGREARARDVTLLFADASSGSRSPALVRQGQIAEIINAKPSARRRILEEAAGVAGLHARRHEAEIRLKAAETNLDRLGDVIGQISGQMDALKRQARQSVRYRALSAEIRKAEAGLLHLRWIEATKALATAEASLREAERAVAEKTRLQAEAAKDQAIAAHTLPPLRDAEAKAGAALARLSAARDALEREEQRAGQRRGELDRQLAQLAHDIAREKTLAADADAVLARLEAEEAEVTAARAEHEAGALSAGPRLTAAADALAASEKRFAVATAAVADIAARRNQLQRTIKEHGDKLARLASQMASVEADLARMAGDGGDDIDDHRAAVEEALETLAYAEERAIEAEAGHAEARDAIEAARKPQRDAETKAQRLDAEVRTLTKLLAPSTGDLWPPVLEQLVVAKGYETALGAALGDDLEVSAAPSAPVHWGGAAIDPADPALPDGAEPLERFVEGPAAMARRLAQVGVVARADGPRLKGLLKPGQRLVSVEGDLWRWDGFTAAAHAPTAAARRLAEKNRLGELNDTLETARREAARFKAALDEAETRLRTAAAAETQAREAARATRRQLDQAREALAAAERRTAERAQRLSALAEAKARLGEAREDAAAELAEAEAMQMELAASPELDRELDEARTQLAVDRAELAEIRAEVQTIERERDAAARRLKAIAEERRQWIERSAGAGARIADIEARRDDTATERAEFDDLPNRFAEQRRALMSEIVTAEATRREAADRLAEAESALADADKRARTALTEMSAVREDAVRGQERLVQSEERLTAVTQAIAEALDCTPEQAASHADFKPGKPLPDPAQLEVDLDRARRERERLGAVNLRADDELTEVQTQHDGLVRERDDLIEAIRRLRTGIANLNREARERLAASFATVDGHFRTLFEKLFGGGVAELQLTDSDDPLEAGLDILAKPPGKKPQSLSLLSGGEQALTAMALIFAVFLTNPAPICVLDEVDAPLDDHNVDRFCNLLDEMASSTDTRFLVITHNPITMARMSRLFGVTMGERGVSQLVAVDLEEAQSYLDVA